jgi:dedicator of cytokinesis protein 3
VLTDYSLCDSYAELRSPLTTACLRRLRSEGSIWKDTPDIFPIAHPFSLVSQLPPPSLLEQNQQSDEAGLTEIGSYNCGLAECAVVILSLVLATPRPNIDRYLIEMLDIEGKDRTSARLHGILAFASSIIHFDAFPRQWLTLSLMSFSAIIKLLYPVIDLLQRPEFIPLVQDATGFDAPLFMRCFELLCDLCGSDELALEDHTQQKRRAGWIIAGDLRDEGSGLLLSLWSALGWSEADGQVSPGVRHGGVSCCAFSISQTGRLYNLLFFQYQTRFTSLAERVLGLCLSSHDHLCETAVEILYSMIYAEYLLLGKFTSIENEIFAKLDGLASFSA